jgi:hypothetical protein
MDVLERQAQAKLPVKVRIDNKTMPEPNTGCLLWIGSVDKDGYGKIYFSGQHKRAHRVIFELHFGEIPKGALIQHKCDTPSCCNIDHLEMGTPLTNMQDKVNKGRLRNQNMSKTHCKHGHEFTPENTRIYDGRRVCYYCLAKKRGYDSNRARFNGLATHCKYGHEYTAENVYYYQCKPNVRFCVECKNLRKARIRKN